MRSNTFWIIVAVQLVIAIASFLFGYWPVGVGLAIVIVALLISRGIEAREANPPE